MTDISIWQFPLSLILALVFLTGSYLLWRFLREGWLRTFLSGRLLCCLSLVAVTVMTAVEGTWGTALHRTPFFWAASMFMMLSLSFAILDSLKAGRNVAHIASHAGMYLLVAGALWGAPDFVDVQTVASGDSSVNIAYSRDGKVVDLPFSIRLEEFRTDYYEDGISPRQYSSRLEMDGKESVTAVNHPCKHQGYLIYQLDYDHRDGAYSVLKLVRDPWLPLVFLGMILLAVGAFMQLRLNWKSRWLTAAIAATAVLFAVLSLARINFGTLAPALRSLWFIPHLVLYMLAYSSLAIALVLGLLSACGVRKDSLRPLSFKLFSTASALLLLGMLCGAVWAKMAWGDWWTWDAKECWAAVTWLVTLLGSHLPARLQKKDIAMLVCIIVAFLGMQVAWYGVEYLPASRTSMHAYK